MKPLISDIFGNLTFDYDIMKEKLPAESYQKLKATISTGDPLDPSLAGIVAHAMKEWAVNEGATHFTHWFQPDRAGTAEKHDAFLSTESFKNGIKPIERFSGGQLAQAEPDASSFPSGGVRSTFEARGYTAWDPTSPAFIKEHPGGKTLCIPSVYLSYKGEALDNKTPLLRSNETLNLAMKKLFNTLKNPIPGIFTTIGPEQEFFLIPRDLYMNRPDLVLTGRTVMGKPSPRGQRLEDHYFGAMPDRVLKFFADLEEKAYRLGIPIKTRHNEVAPSQFELAPIFEHSNIANDHNQLLMDLMKKVAIENGLVALLYEKPFAGINGSGKHNNWSMMTFEGRNLLDPGENKSEHIEFLLVLSIIIKAVHKRSKLLRSVIATSGNDFRLGANEAPPAIMSVYIGDTLENLFSEIESGKTVKKISSKETIDEKSKFLGFTVGLNQLPNIRRDNTDRNRTSPFAFTGNKFEFRAVGSSQTLGFLNTALNAIIAETTITAEKLISKKVKSGVKLDNAIFEVVKEFYIESKNVVFNGNNYSPDWVLEAEKRGLPNIKTGFEALLELPKNADLFSSLNILTERELTARFNVRLDHYISQIHIEADTLIDMINTGVIPAIVKYASDMFKVQDVLFTSDEVAEFTSKFKKLKESIVLLKNELSLESDSEEEIGKVASFTIRPLMEEIRTIVDDFESIIPKNLWPFPSYADLLHTHY